MSPSRTKRPDDRFLTQAQRATGADVYAYFNNDVGSHAPRDAVTLRAMMGEQR